MKNAMNMMKKKLNSERGASISWALLIFLVCTVVGSVVLVAGTTASGRFSKLAENDQGYYAVTSSAGLLRDVLNQSVTVTRSVSDSDGTKSYSISYGDTAPDPIVKGLVRKLMDWPDVSGVALTAAITEDKWLTDAAALTGVTNAALSFTGGSNIDAIMTGVEGSIRIDPEGMVVAVIQKDSFGMQLTFELNRTITTTADVKTDVFLWKLKEARTLTS